MAELLCREKELFKINQELNLLSLNSAAEAMYPAKPSPAIGGAAPTRYATFQKQKGPSTLLRKKNAATSQAKPTPKSPPGRDAAAAAAVVMARAVATSPPPDASLLTKSKAPDWKNNKSMGATTVSPPGNRGAAKFSTFTRDVSSKTAMFVKYRNPNFSESPSLDMLLRNASEEATKNDVVEVEVTQKRESTTVVNGQAKKQLTQDNFIKFLKAKVVILEEDHAQQASELSRQKEQLEKALEAQRKSENQRDQTLNANKHLTEQLIRTERQCEDSGRRQKERQQEFTSQQRELEQLKRESKVARQTNVNLENRLSRAQEDADTARLELKQLREEQREQLDAQRKELKQRDNRIRALKRQRNDLLNAYKKQLYMIDNLKRQTNCMEQSAAIGFGEKEFNKVLDWNSKT
ncbi:epidermal growth factor receptor substrate 15 homolog [Drosophila serrata]|uniref:epidermal growth factor receptor substrate 15 homolog n=1 Tax=Drosophila serrata TaxID=7274 RepID=UPI000A1D3424|nr:epidermal growth factor receptor substrate 15 homolog [Drosophila serrata]